MKQAIKSIVRVLLLGVGGSLVIVYGMKQIAPKTWKHMEKSAGASYANRVNHHANIAKLGLDQAISQATIFPWDEVCVFKDYEFHGYLPEKQQEYAAGYTVVHRPDRIIFAVSPLDYQWLFLFKEATKREARWIDACTRSNCVDLSSLQKEGCFERDAVMRAVFHMREDHKAQLKYLVTNPEDNMPEDKSPKAGQHQNALRVPYD